MTKKEFFAIFLILIIATFFRFWNITTTPPGLYPDEAMNGNNALEANATGEYKTYYPENNGREGLFINVQAASIAVFGNHPWSLRIVSALFGVFTVLGIYFLTKTIFQKKMVLTLATTSMLALSFWHVNFSRIGFRAIMVPFCLVWSFYFIIVAWQKKKIWPAIIAGIFFGVGFHTYIAFRFTPLLALVPIIYYFFQNKKSGELKKYFQILFAWLGITFLIALPIGLYFLNNPGDFFGRSGQVSIFNSSNPLLDLGESIGKTAIMFNFYGDCNWRHNYACKPQLDIFTGTFFLLGLIITLKKIIKKDGSERFPYILILAWMLIMSLPSILTKEGLPHALRAIGMIPPTFILAGIGFEYLWGVFQEKNKKIGLTLLLISGLIIAVYNGGQYSAWAQRQEVKDSFEEKYTLIADYLNLTPQNINKYVLVNAGGTLVNDIPMPSQSIMFITDTYRTEQQKEKNIFYILPENISQINSPAIIIPLQSNEQIKQTIGDIFPNSSIIDVNGFIIFKTN